MALLGLQDQIARRRSLPAPPVRRALRGAAGISLTTLAEALGVSRETVRLWELGAHEPYDRHLDAYIEALALLAEHEGQ